MANDSREFEQKLLDAVEKLTQSIDSNCLAKSKAFDKFHPSLLALCGLFYLSRKAITYPNGAEGDTVIEVVVSTPKLRIIVKNDGSLEIPKEIKAINSLALLRSEDSDVLSEEVEKQRNINLIK